MCRFLAYKGSSIILDQLLYQPDHSLIKQSYKAKEMEEPLNGDGFGIGWYANQLSNEPAVFNSIRPAWNNKNLRSITPKIRSECLFAHVRAATVGNVSELNCHPFQYENFLMMHNGGIKQFDKIKRPLLESLSNERFRWIGGQTDSQHIFALTLDHLLDTPKKPAPQDYLDAFCQTFDKIEQLKSRYGLDEPSFLNLMITDGDLVVGSRYVTDPEKSPRSLYHSEGGKYECKNGKCLMNKECAEDEKAVLVVSEKLNNNENDWYEVPENHMLIIDEQLNIDFKAI